MCYKQLGYFTFLGIGLLYQNIIMKTYLIIALLLISSSLNAQNQFKIIYHSILNADRDISKALQGSGLSLEKIRFVNKISNSTVKVGALLVDGSKSSFRYFDTFVPEKYKEYVAPVPQSEWDLMSFYIKDRKNGEFYIVKGNLAKNTIVVDELKKYHDWKLVPGDSIINDYPCKKAVHGKLGHEAWYTPKIPLPEGPEVFGGLPGLIVLLRLDQEERYLILHKIESKDFDTSAFDKGIHNKTISYEDYLNSYMGGLYK
jgi:GLPGLI family protein